MLWGPDGRLLRAEALRFGVVTGPNVAEMSALEWGVRHVAARGAKGSVLVLGDSNLSISFCTRRAKPGTPELFTLLRSINALRRDMSCRLVFRHVERSNNAMADWLSNVAKHLDHSMDLTAYVPTTVGLFSEPPWPAEQVAGWAKKGLPAPFIPTQDLMKASASATPPICGAIREPEVGLSYHGRKCELQSCEVCSGSVPGLVASGSRQCWGCGKTLHLKCSGLSEWPVGPFHCSAC